MAFLMKECFCLRTSPAASCADLAGNSLQGYFGLYYTLNVGFLEMMPLL